MVHSWTRSASDGMAASRGVRSVRRARPCPSLLRRHAAVGVAHLVKRGIFHAECEQSLVLDGNSSERFGTVWESVFLFQKAFQNLM